MRTFSFIVGLLLIIALYYSTAMPRGVSETSPESCCFRFFPKKIPRREIQSISKTHNRCSEKAFVFQTPKGPICVSQAQEWARKAFELQNLSKSPQ